MSAWKGLWITATLSLGIGIGLAATLIKAHPRKLSSIIALLIVIPTTLLILFNCVFILYDIIHKGAFTTRHLGLYDSIANIGYVVALLLPLLKSPQKTLSTTLLRLCQQLN
jgi:hypothetical protein